MRKNERPTSNGSDRILAMSGAFAGSDIKWGVAVWKLDSDSPTAHLSQLSETAIASVLRTERREAYQRIGNMLFNAPSRYWIRIYRSSHGTETWLFNRGIHVAAYTKPGFVPTPADEIVKRLAKFCVFLFTEGNDGKPQPQNWHPAIASEAAIMFWASALITSYCNVLGIAEK